MKLMIPTRIATVFLLSSVVITAAYAGQAEVYNNFNGAGFPSNPNGSRSLKALTSLEEAAEDCLDFHAVRYDGFVSEESCRTHCVFIGPEICLAYSFHEEGMACFLKTPCATQANVEEVPLPTEPAAALLFPSLLSMLEEIPESLSAATSSFSETNDNADVMSPAPPLGNGDDSSPPPAPSAAISLLPARVGSASRIRLSNATKKMTESQQNGTVSNNTEGINQDALNSGGQHVAEIDLEVDGMNILEREANQAIQTTTESKENGLDDEVPRKLATKFKMKSRFRCIQKPLKETQVDQLKKCKSGCKKDLRCNAFSYDRINKICTTHESGCRSGSELVFSKGYKTGVKEMFVKEVAINADGATEQQVKGWGAALAFDEPCASGSGTDKYYHCNADCAANCREMDPRQTGLLVPMVLKSDLQYCDSVHPKDSYGNDVCCCGEVWDAHQRSDKIVPCEGEATAWNACDTWCRLHSTQLGVGTAADCRPHSGWCFPYGLLTHQRDNANELCSSIECSTLKCCCDQQVA